MMASLIRYGSDVASPSVKDLRGKALPNTASGLDGLHARIVKNVWYAAGTEFTLVIARCMQEGVFPDVWKAGG